MVEEPREHHYRFAHRYLPTIAFRSPDGFRQQMRSNGDRVLSDAWKAVGKDLPRKQGVKPDGLWFVWSQYEMVELAMVVMPKPIAPAEAYFVGVALGGSLLPEVFTLEHGVDLE